MQLLMRIATDCLEEGIPMAQAQEMTLGHSVLARDEMLVRNVFASVYAVALQEDYMAKHKIKPLRSVPEETIQAMRTEIFLNANYDKRKPLTDPTGSRRFVCVGVTGHIDYDDSLDHRQLFAQALHLFNSGERFWLNDDEIKVLIKENEPYQQLYTLEEMIAATFRKPKPSEEARWLGIDEIKSILGNCYASFDPDTSNTAIGNALNDSQFSFDIRRLGSGKEYKLVEK